MVEGVSTIRSETTPDSRSSPRRVNGSAVLRFAQALRVTPLARYGTEALTGRKDTFRPIDDAALESPKTIGEQTCVVLL